jgi:hypothetical protein
MSESEGDYATELNMFDNVGVERKLKKGGEPDAATPGHPSGQCCGSGKFIPDPVSEFFPSRIRIFSIPDPHKRIKVFFPQKNCF